jgi:hypothetical protein
VDHDGLHRDEMVESLEVGLIEPGLCPEFEFAVGRHFLSWFAQF